MFIQNQISHLHNHKDIIATEIERADKLLFVVAYVSESGVDIILEKIGSRPAKLLCSLDMGITQLSGIKKLIENNVEVKVYKSNKGTFHSKIWLFGDNTNQWKMLIGSANLTRAAFIDNVEASVLVEEQATTSNALLFFNYLWDGENSYSLTTEEIDSLQEKIRERKAFKSQSAQIQPENSNDEQKIQVIFDYVRNWIDIPKYESKGIGALWRGWYIIPDHGYINNEKIIHLKSYLPFIESGIRQSDKQYQHLLEAFVRNSNFQRSVLRTSHHNLFVRQAKNYLIKLGWCCHPIKKNGKPDKKILHLTGLGVRVNQCNNLESVKALYTDYFLNHSFNGLYIVKFTAELVQILGYVTLEEFNYFVIHAYNDDDFHIIVNLIKIYRSLSTANDFYSSFRKYFEKEKGRTATNVYGNYLKKVKHTISVIGWCEGFVVDQNFTLRLENGNL